MYKFSTSSLQRMKGIDPRLKQIAELAIIITPIDFGIPKDGGFRTPERQNALFNEGRSKLDGYKKIGPHQKGMALDVYAYVDGEASWDKMHLTIVAGAMLEAARQLGHTLTWGGWWPWDMPHFQLDD